MAKIKSEKKPAKKPAAKKAVKKPAKKPAAKKAVKAGKPTKARAAKKAPNPQQAPRKVDKSPLLAAPYGGLGDMTPAVHDFAKAFKSLMAGPPKRSAASLLGDEPPVKINGVTLRELVDTFVADNARLGELTTAAKTAGFNPQAFSIVAVLHLPYMRETKAAVELYTKLLADG